MVIIFMNLFICSCTAHKHAAHLIVKMFQLLNICNIGGRAAIPNATPHCWLAAKTNMATALLRTSSFAESYITTKLK